MTHEWGGCRREANTDSKRDRSAPQLPGCLSRTPVKNEKGDMRGVEHQCRIEDDGHTMSAVCVAGRHCDDRLMRYMLLDLKKGDISL